MKARRVQLGLTGAELAERARISASYVSLIESGAKVPDEAVAARLARELGDDEDLYRGWARAARLGFDRLGLVNRLEAIAQTPAYLNLVESGQALPRLDAEPARQRQEEAAEVLRARLREVASNLTTVAHPAPARRPAPEPTEEAVRLEAAVQVPVLPEGADPIHLEAGACVPGERLTLDRRLVGPAAGLVFAYEVTAASLPHLRGIAAAGDIVVLRQGGDLAPDRVCAVRTERGIVLSRVVFKDGVLLLRPGDGETEFQALDVPDARTLQAVVAGTHVLILKR